MARPSATPRFSPAPSEADRLDFLRRVGRIPEPPSVVGPRPDDPVERLHWDLRNPGRLADGRLIIDVVGNTPIVRIDFAPPPDALFDPGVVLATRHARGFGMLEHHKKCLPAGGLAELVGRHCRGDLGENGALDPGSSTGTVRSIYHLARPGVIHADPDGLDLVVATSFGLAGVDDPELGRTATLICLGSEPYLRNHDQGPRGLQRVDGDVYAPAWRVY